MQLQAVLLGIIDGEGTCPATVPLLPSEVPRGMSAWPIRERTYAAAAACCLLLLAAAGGR